MTELRPADQYTDRPTWYIFAFTSLLLAQALFTCGAIPAALVGAVVVACFMGEIFLGLRALLELRRPAAEVLVLARERRRGAR
jgi:hypothetical protein